MPLLVVEDWQASSLVKIDVVNGLTVTRTGSGPASPVVSRQRSQFLPGRLVDEGRPAEIHIDSFWLTASQSQIFYFFCAQRFLPRITFKVRSLAPPPAGGSHFQVAYEVISFVVILSYNGAFWVFWGFAIPKHANVSKLWYYPNLILDWPSTKILNGSQASASQPTRHVAQHTVNRAKPALVSSCCASFKALPSAKVGLLAFELFVNFLRRRCVLLTVGSNRVLEVGYFVRVNLTTKLLGPISQALWIWRSSRILLVQFFNTFCHVCSLPDFPVCSVGIYGSCNRSAAHNGSAKCWSRCVCYK